MGNNVIIEVRDDGAGINVDEVRQKAVDKGTITSEQAELMSDKEIVELLFRPSFQHLKKLQIFPVEVLVLMSLRQRLKVLVVILNVRVYWVREVVLLSVCHLHWRSFRLLWLSLAQKNMQFRLVILK